MGAASACSIHLCDRPTCQEPEAVSLRLRTKFEQLTIVSKVSGASRQADSYGRSSRHPQDKRSS